jgi:hypothetical protein
VQGQSEASEHYFKTDRRPTSVRSKCTGCKQQLAPFSMKKANDCPANNNLIPEPKPDWIFWSFSTPRVALGRRNGLSICMRRPPLGELLGLAYD